ncbi:MAG: helix-turn-helix domain-containing protein [Lysobacterales bacterium]|jgi:DNA-binding transcriptional ArsR family regulator
MDTKNAARLLEALANKTRLEIFQHLCGAGDNGITVGKINEKITIPASTLSHHIGKLVVGGLVEQQRHGRQLICTVNQHQIDDLVMYLANECCGEHSSIWE